MTVEETINRLNNMKEYYNDRTEPYYVGFDYKDNDAVDNAIKVLEQTRWIPVSERLPKQQQIVLIQDFGQTTIGYLNAENRWRDLTNLDDYLKGVEAWMPLPEKYKEAD